MIFITHRLSTARRADKVAMMENGVSFLIVDICGCAVAANMNLIEDHI